MKTHIATIAAVAVLALSAPIALTAVAAPTTSPEPGTPPASAPVTPTPEAKETPTPQVGGWPEATFNGRTVTISNLAPGWDITLSAMNTKTRKSYTYRAKAKGTSVVIEMKGLPAGTYDIAIPAGDLPANESLYWDHKITGPASDVTKAPSDRGGLAKTSV